MKKQIGGLLSLIALTLSAHATLLDLGAPGPYFERSYAFAGFNSTAAQGQTLSLTVNFNTSVHVFSGTYRDFEIGLNLAATGSGAIDFILGTGYLLDAQGQPMFAPERLGSASGCFDSTHGLFILGLFPLFADNTTAPLDFYGFHFDLTLPDNNFSITSGELILHATDFISHGRQTEPFRIGPHVPDNSTTVVLLAVAFAVLLIIRHTNLAHRFS